MEALPYNFDIQFNAYDISTNCNLPLLPVHHHSYDDFRKINQHKSAVDDEAFNTFCVIPKVIACVRGYGHTVFAVAPVNFNNAFVYMRIPEYLFAVADEGFFIFLEYVFPFLFGLRCTVL
ncbi:MAG: hypothetical protein IJE14_09745 [Clostridia bacterium]|nr:hypothetical protein [Clostridia bacterium]